MPLVEPYDRHRRDRDEPQGKQPVGCLWVLLGVFGLIRKVVHRVAFGYLATFPGRFALFGTALYAAASSAWSGEPWSAYLGGWTLGLTVGIGIYGAHAYYQRRKWEDRVQNTLYHDIPGHTRREQEVVWWQNKANVGRWTGSWDFGFRLPPDCRESDLEGLAEHLRERLPAAHGASWRIRWDLRASTGYATLVPDMPDSLTRDELLERLEDEGGVDRDRFPLGVSVDGVEVWDVEQDPHILSVGKTGKGKSVAQLGVVCHALDLPKSWVLIACDPKRVELNHLHGYKSVRVVARDLESITEAIQRAEAEMDKRYQRMDAAGANHIRDLHPNAKRILVIVDELQQVTMPSGDKSDEGKAADELHRSARSALERIAALGRAAGVHLYLSTQRPDVALGILTGPLKHNLSGKLACGKMDATTSGMALDTDAAAQLPATPKGRAIWQCVEGEKKIQVAYTAKDDLPPKDKAPKAAAGKNKGGG